MQLISIKYSVSTKPRTGFASQCSPGQVVRAHEVMLQKSYLCRNVLQVAGLESLAKIMCMEVLDLRRERDRAVASRTVAGHLRNLLGYCLSLFCILRHVLTTSHCSTHPLAQPSMRCAWPACSTAVEKLCSGVTPKSCGRRMLFSVKALLFGEDFTSDPVSKALAFCLRSFSRGHLVRNLQMFSQVSLTLET